VKRLALCLLSVLAAVNLGSVTANAGENRGSSLPLAHPRANPAAAALRTVGRLTVIGSPPTGRQQPSAQADGWYAISAVAPSAYLVRCPGHSKWCGEVESLDWSANGRWLALSVTSFGGANPYNGIHVVDLTTGVDRQIRSCVPVEECDWFDIDWSPDGSRLAYVSNGRIYIVNRDGSGRRQLRTATIGPDSSPSWSPDGRRIAFATRPKAHDLASVFVIRSDGGHRVLLTRGASEPAWSPDGTSIAIASRCRGIKLITPAGRDVTPGVGACRKIGVSGIPVWSPDGRRIAIVGHRGSPVAARAGIYVMDASGEHLLLVTGETNARGVTGRADASWQPPRRP
jgi:Tol biopolymer transport system component